MSGEQWILAVAGTAVTIMNYLFASGKWAGETDASLRSAVSHLRELLTMESSARQRDVAQLQQSITHIDRMITQLDERRHDMRAELTHQQAKYWEEMGKRLDKTDREMGQRLDAIDRRLGAIEGRRHA